VALTGEGKTEAVTKALEERFAAVRCERRQGKAPIEELRAIAGRAAAHLKRPYVNRAEMLYDERGLRK
jgi:antitoxin VapB